MKPPVGRLFWKLFGTLWIAMMVSFSATVAYFLLAQVPMPPPPDAGRIVPWIAATAVSVIFSASVAWYLSGPLRHLRWGLQRAAEERFDTRVKPLMGRRSDEIVDLAGEFDAMAARLQQLTSTRRSLLHDLSHELRSPLARLQAAVGLWRQSPEEGAQLATRVEREVGRLDGLVEELLMLHRLESAEGPGGEPLLVETLDLRQVLDAIVADASFEARASGRQVVLDSEGVFLASVNGDVIYRALENVVRNAIRYTPAGGSVEIGARTIDAGLWLDVTVADRGPGVPADKLGSIFEPFVRLESGPGSGSSGLGLALARRGVVSHGGSIEAMQREGGGLLVHIRIPLS